MLSMSESPRATRRIPVETAADALVEALHTHGVQFIFVNLGTDHAPLIETFAKFRAREKPMPTVVVCPHEAVAIGAAHGFAQVTGRPQAVVVHVDAGTGNLAGGMHNVARSRVPVFILAGRAPFTDRGELPGTRDSYVQFIQDVFDQPSIVRPYVKWEHELHRAANIGRVVERAFKLAVADPPGAVYLTVPRETLAEPLDFVDLPDPASSPPPVPTIPEESALAGMARWLCAAERPLVITSYIGRRATAVAELTALADLLALPVLEMLPRSYMNFPTDHPLYLGVGESPRLAGADLVLVIDCDVPWVPSLAQPPETARIIHLDIDPLKADLPLWMFGAHRSACVDAAATLPCLRAAIQREWTAVVEERVNARRPAVEREARDLRRQWEASATPPGRGEPMAPGWLTKQLGVILPREAIVVSELVTNAALTARHLPRSLPGSFFAAGGTSLGWGLSAAAGVKLARPDAEVVCLVGDGSFLFGAPAAALWVSRRYQAPFVTVVYNNRGWAAPKEATVHQHPQGFAVRHREFFSSFGDGVDLAAVATAAGGHGERVVSAGDLSAAFARAREAVREGRPAVLDVQVTPA
jgi:acetolactate synthase-1/2/3 large subunit